MCFFMVLSKKLGLFSSRNQGVPRWPTYTWLVKLLMRDVSPRAPMLTQIYVAIWSHQAMSSCWLMA